MYFSYFDASWFDEKLESDLNEIVFRAANLLNTLIQTQRIVSQVCGKHEDKACVIQPMSQRFVNHYRKKYLGAEDDDLQNFRDEPQEIELRNSKIYRVIPSLDLKVAKGNWWFRGCVPRSKKEWRANYAVLIEWNADSFIAEYVIKNEKIEALAGPAASQHVYWYIYRGKLKFEAYPNTSCILAGGAEQLWIDPEDLDENRINPNPTGW